MFTVSKVLGSLLLPPGIFVVSLGAYFVLQLAGNKKEAHILIALVGLWLGLFSLPIVSHLLHKPLEQGILPYSPQSEDQVIVVLGAGAYSNPLEYDFANPSEAGLARLAYAAHLHKRLMLPILVSGGSPTAKVVEAEAMRNSLMYSFQVPVRFMETHSRNTLENAKFSSQILKQAGFSRIILVTHAYHIKRATIAFENHGIKVNPAPIHFTGFNGSSFAIISKLPSFEAMYQSSIACKEYLGLLWYAILPK